MTRKLLRPLALVLAIILILIGAALFIHPWDRFIAASADRPQSPQADSAGGTGLVFDQPVVDIGEVSGSVDHHFHFVNKAASQITIEGVVPSCSCTVAKLAKKTYSPGESGPIAIHFSLPANGLVRRAVSVDVDTSRPDLHRESQRLLIYIRHTPDVVVGGPVTIRLLEGLEECTYFHVTDYRDRPLSIRSLKSSSSALSAAIWQIPTEYQSGWKYVIRVKGRRDGVSTGRHRAVIEMVTDDPVRPLLRVDVYMDAIDRVRVIPAEVKLRRKANSTDLSGRVFLDDIAGEALEIEGISGPDSLSYDVAAVSKSRKLVVLRCPSDRVSELPSSLRITVRLRKPTTSTCCFEVSP